MQPSLRERVERLRTLTRTASDLEAPWDCFHDDFASDPQFLRAGVRGRSAVLEDMLGAVASQLVPLADASRFLILHLPAFGLWHGAGQIGDHLAVFYYLEGVDQGLLGLVEGPFGPDLVIARFSLLPVARGAIVACTGGEA